MTDGSLFPSLPFIDQLPDLIFLPSAIRVRPVQLDELLVDFLLFPTSLKHFLLQVDGIVPAT